MFPVAFSSSVLVIEISNVFLTHHQQRMQLPLFNHEQRMFHTAINQ
jgi:hypothetical protein